MGQRVEALDRAVDAAGARGVIFYTNQYDEVATWDMPRQRASLEARGIEHVTFGQMRWPVDRNRELEETLAAFAAGMVWLRALPWRWGRTAAPVLAVCMGLSRLYVGVHYPTDVLVGALIGALCAWIVWRACQAWEEKRDRVY